MDINNLLLSDTLNKVIQQLANFFGMTTEVIIENMPEWLAEYAWYSLWRNISCITIVSAILLIFAFFIIYTTQEGEGIPKPVIAISIAVVVGLIGLQVGQCVINPTLYGLDALLSTLG